MKLIIGMGNIGRTYKNNRHNVGFMCLDRFAELHKLKAKKAHNYSYFRYDSGVLIKPSTYMNQSGEAYLSALSAYSDIDDVLVVMDDIDLPLGEIKIRPSGGDGGHNGLKSILAKAGNREIHRIRIGIGRQTNVNPKDHVLTDFSAEERKIILPVIDLVVRWLEIYLNRDFNALLDEFSQWKKNPIPTSEAGINRPKEDS